MLLCMTQRDHLVYSELAVKSLAMSKFPGEILILDDASERASIEALEKSLPQGVHLAGNEEPRGLTSLWNLAYSEFMAMEVDYLVVANNDVIFTRNWWQPLAQAFEAEDCGIAGPMTNQPGHQPHQRLPIQRPTDFIRHSDQSKPTGTGYRLDFVNGFCFMLKRDRLVPFDEAHLFDPKVKDYGNEDEYQKRMREKGLYAYAMADSRVYHWKDVSFESWREGRMGMALDKLPPRLEADGDFKPVEVASGDQQGIG